jgi:hypothetical protein
MVPLVAARLSPGGRLPEVIDQVYAGVPPDAVMVLEYPLFTVPEDSVALIVNAEAFWAAATATDRVADLVCAGLDESATLKVTLDVPVEVGVPEITPDEARASPAGRPVGDEMDQV